MRERITPTMIAQASGAYQHVLKTEPKTLVFVAGQTGWIDGQAPSSDGGAAAGGGSASRIGHRDLEAQVRRTWRNVGECLRAAGADFKDVVRMNTYVVDLAFNEYRSIGPRVRRELTAAYPFPDATVAVRALMPPDGLIEIDAIAALDELKPPARFDPPTVHPPVGPYQHVIVVPCNTLVFVAGQVGVDQQGQMVGVRGADERRRGVRGADFETQLRQAFTNVKACLNAAGADFRDVTRLTSYVVPEVFNEYRGAMRTVRSQFFGEHRPAATSLCMAGLIPPDALVELEVTAALML